MSLITLEENTSIEDVNRWMDVEDSRITFKILVKSSFQIFVEGVALGSLHSWKGKQIHIRLYKTPDQLSSLSDLHPIFKTLFGLELLRLAERVTDDDEKPIFLRDERGVDLDGRFIIGSTIWKEAQRRKGLMGDGKNVYLISRHNYEIPSCLREGERSDKFPRFDYFKKRLQEVLNGLRSEDIRVVGPEEQLIEWLHQIAENAHKHGGRRIADGSSIEGFKGIVLGKYIFNRSGEVQQRKDLPDLVRNYLTSLISSERYSEKKLICNYASVIDLGDGIQNTLPNYEMPNDFHKFCFAFKEGVSRDSGTNDGLSESGYGLSQALHAARKLNALLHVVSGEIMATADFSRISNEDSYEEFPLRSDDNSLKKKIGTSLSILWVEEDVPRLFPPADAPAEV